MVLPIFCPAEDCGERERVYLIYICIDHGFLPRKWHIPKFNSVFVLCVFVLQLWKYAFGDWRILYILCYFIRKSFAPKTTNMVSYTCTLIVNGTYLNGDKMIKTPSGWEFISFFFFWINELFIGRKFRGFFWNSIER